MVCIVGCGQDPEVKESPATEAEQVVKYSSLFKIDEKDRYTEVEVKLSNNDGAASRKYILVQKDQEAPSGIEGTIVRVPLESMALTSTTQIPLLSTLDQQTRLTGFAHCEYIRDEKVLPLIESGTVTELSGAQDIDLEKLIESAPEIIMVYPWADANYERFEEAGITVIYNCDYLESHPLGRAEWLKFMGLLCGKGKEASGQFEKIETSYNDTKTKIMLSSSKPSVIVGDLYNGVWYAPGGGSYIAQFLRDAGAKYLWHDNTSDASIELDFEALYEKAIDTQFWGTVTSSEKPVTKEYFTNQNELFKDFRSYKEQGLFVCNSKDVDYFGQAVLEPHIILADLAKIFHPSYMEDHKSTYFLPVK